MKAIGFRTELLPSRNHTEKVVMKLDRQGLEIAKRFALKYCAMSTAVKRGSGCIRI